MTLRRILFLLLAACHIAPLAAQEPAATYWKGNLHTHSFWSDGTDFPEMIVDWYRSRDYHFLALTDHNILSQGEKWMKVADINRRAPDTTLTRYTARFGEEWVETRGEPESPEFSVRLKGLEEFRGEFEKPGEFLLIQAEEISDQAQGRPVHMNAANLKELVRPLGGSTVREAISNNLRAVEDQALRLQREILLHVNHPNFGYAVTAEDLAAVTAEHFFEVYNGHPSVGHLGDKLHPGLEKLWDIANTIRIGQLKAHPLYGLGVDDCHEYHGRPGSRPGRGWVMVKAKSLDAETLIKAMKAGDFYASSGVLLRDVVFDATTKTLRLRIEPEEGVNYTTHFIGTLKDYDATSEEQLDTKGFPITRKYSDDIGRILDTQQGLSPSYQLTGKEIFVRAVVTSSKPHPDPSHAGQREQAWTQPVTN